MIEKSIYHYKNTPISCKTIEICLYSDEIHNEFTQKCMFRYRKQNYNEKLNNLIWFSLKK
jgi:hypothetical protein